MMPRETDYFEKRLKVSETSAETNRFVGNFTFLFGWQVFSAMVAR